MDSSELIFTGAVFGPNPLADPSKIDHMQEGKKKQAAKDFESVLIHKLLDAMRRTVGEWGFEKDGASEQVDGIFSLYLARDIADKGGFGLWKDICRFLGRSEQKTTTSESLDKSV